MGQQLLGMGQHLLGWVKAHHHLFPWVVSAISGLMQLVTFIYYRKLVREARKLRSEMATRTATQAMLRRFANELNRLSKMLILQDQRIVDVEIQHEEISRWTETTMQTPAIRGTIPFPAFRQPSIHTESRKAIYPREFTTLIPDGSPTPSEVDLSWPDDTDPDIDATRIEGRKKLRR